MSNPVFERLAPIGGPLAVDGAGNFKSPIGKGVLCIGVIFRQEDRARLQHFFWPCKFALLNGVEEIHDDGKCVVGEYTKIRGRPPVKAGSRFFAPPTRLRKTVSC